MSVSVYEGRDHRSLADRYHTVYRAYMGLGDDNLVGYRSFDFGYGSYLAWDWGESISGSTMIILAKASAIHPMYYTFLVRFLRFLTERDPVG